MRRPTTAPRGVIVFLMFWGAWLYVSVMFDGVGNWSDCVSLANAPTFLNVIICIM